MARASNLYHWPTSIGVQGLADAIILLGMAFETLKMAQAQVDKAARMQRLLSIQIPEQAGRLQRRPSNQAPDRAARMQTRLRNQAPEQTPRMQIRLSNQAPKSLSDVPSTESSIEPRSKRKLELDSLAPESSKKPKPSSPVAESPNMTNAAMAAEIANLLAASNDSQEIVSSVLSTFGAQEAKNADQTPTHTARLPPPSQPSARQASWFQQQQQQQIFPINLHPSQFKLPARHPSGW